MKIGFVGAGRMGGPMVERLVQAGEDVRVLQRSSDAAAGVADVARGADAIVICVHNDEQVRDICFGTGLLDRIESGATLIVHTTGSPDLVREIQAAVPAEGVLVVDAPVSGGPQDISAGTITTFVGGDADAVEAATRVLARYADPIVHVGPLGAGQAVKLVNNAVFLSNIEVLCAGIEFGRQLGVEESALIDCLATGSARSFALNGIARVGSASEFRGAVSEFLDKDLAVVRRVATSTDSDLGAIGRLLGVSVSQPHPVRPEPAGVS